MFRGIASLPRLNTCSSLSSAGSPLENETLLHETNKLFHGSAVFLRRNTAVLREICACSVETNAFSLEI